jgi:hypothetical protein
MIRSARQAVRTKCSGRRCRRRRTRQDDRTPRPVTVLVLLRVPEGGLATSAHGCRSGPTGLGPFPVLLPGADGPVLRGCGPTTGGSGSGVPERPVCLGMPSTDVSRLGAVLVAECRPSPPDDVPRSRCGRGAPPGRAYRRRRLSSTRDPSPCCHRSGHQSLGHRCPGPRCSPGEHLERGGPGRPSVGQPMRDPVCRATVGPFGGGHRPGSVAAGGRRPHGAAPQSACESGRTQDR